MLGEEILIGRAFGLRQEAGMDDVEDILELVEDAELAGDVLGVPNRAVGQDQLAAGQSRQRRAEFRIGFEQRQVDIVGEVEELVGVDPVLLHQSLQRRAVAVIVILPQRMRGQAVQRTYGPYPKAIIYLRCKHQGTHPPLLVVI